MVPQYVQDRALLGILDINLKVLYLVHACIYVVLKGILHMKIYKEKLGINSCPSLPGKDERVVG